jgi:hypothetical protein
VVFMDTSPTSALEHIHQYQPGILVVTTDLGQGGVGHRPAGAGGSDSKRAVQCFNC